ncbi:MAG: translation initiation factor 1 [Bacteroidetes bacterium GWF2_41_31]|nr:MAG: translation initiation factor 1 [Bacteroidetes bacterium GWF2_41_31]OFZ02364.1 MAG: translation initiation factor 1 [Bacteroidetes bacterium RIFOXYB12_FULL_41_6]
MPKYNDFNLVFSTNPDLVPLSGDKEMVETKEAKHQSLIVSLDKKQRRGKKVTLIEGFVGNENDLKELGKILKSKCGVGGSVKDNQIIIQGDFKEKIAEILRQSGYKTKLK